MEHVTQRYGVPKIGKFRDVLPHIVVDRQLALQMKLDNSQSCKLLGHRSDIEPRTRSVGHKIFKARQTESLGIHKTSILDNAHGSPWMIRYVPIDKKRIDLFLQGLIKLTEGEKRKQKNEENTAYFSHSSLLSISIPQVKTETTSASRQSKNFQILATKTLFLKVAICQRWRFYDRLRRTFMPVKMTAFEMQKMYFPTVSRNTPLGLFETKIAF